MKKNININLFGTLYAIDEDACKLLEDYLDNIKSHFAKREGGDEIADDIEHRVAEHLWSLKEEGRDAIDIETVKQIISSIGKPAEVDGGLDDSSADASADDTNAEKKEDEPSSKAEGADTNARQATGADTEPADAKWSGRLLRHVKTHRFYRDGKDKIAGGVVSGLRHYCGGGDIVVWRVCAVFFVIAAFTLKEMISYYVIHNLLGLLFALPLILYVALWLLAPVARTAEERLRMAGEEVTPESISRAVIAEVDEDSKPKAVRRRGGTIGARLVEIVTFGVKSAALVAFAVMTAFALAYLVCGVVYSIVGEEFLTLFNENTDDLRVLTSIPMLGLYWVISAWCWLAVALIPLLGIVRSFKSVRKPLGLAAIATLTGTWIVAITVGILLFVLFGIHASKESKLIDRQQNTRNGIYLSRWTWDTLYEKGWTMNSGSNIMHGLLFASGDTDPLCLNDEPLYVAPEKQGKPMTLSLSRKQSVVAGEYKLECLSICTAMDATLSVWSCDKCLATLRLDGYGAADDSLLKDYDWVASRKNQLFSEQSDSATWVDNVSKGNDNWHYLASKPFHHDGGTLEYRLRIGQHDVTDATVVGSEVWMAHETVRKQ